MKYSDNLIKQNNQHYEHMHIKRVFLHAFQCSIWEKQAHTDTKAVHNKLPPMHAIHC